MNSAEADENVHTYYIVLRMGDFKLLLGHIEPGWRVPPPEGEDPAIKANTNDTFLPGYSQHTMGKTLDTSSPFKSKVTYCLIEEFTLRGI